MTMERLPAPSTLSVLSQLLDALHLLEAATMGLRRALAAYCDEVHHVDGLPYLRGRELTDSLTGLLEAAIQDIEARGLAKR